MTEENGFSTAPLVISLDLELATVAGAARGAQLLAGLLAHKALDGEHEREAPSCVFSILALVTERLGQLRRVIRNEENPAHLWAPHNAVEDPATSGESPGDIVLFSWGSLRLPLVMWSNRGVETQQEARERAERGRKATGRKSREEAPESSKVSQGEPPKEPEPPTRAAHDRGHQNG